MRDSWTRENGFPGGSVSAIAQTNDGYLWIGTDKGLIRFDGLEFRVFQQAVPESFAIGPVQSLVTDAEGNLWVLLQSTRILRFHNGKFELGREEAEFGVTAISRRQNGAVLLSSLAYGTLTYRDGKFEVLPSSTAEEPFSTAGATATYDNLSSRLSWATGVAAHRLAEPSAAVTSMVETSDRKVWLGTADKGIFCVNNGRISDLGKGKPSSKITGLLPAENGQLWIGTEKGVVRWDGAKLTETGVPRALRDRAISAAIRDRDSNIWVGTSAGLYRIHGSEVSFEGSSDTNSDPITALFEDREGNLWVGTPRGIERWRDTTFVTYAAGGQGESDGPIYVDQEQRVWFAHFKGGLHQLKEGESESVSNDGLDRDVVYSITGRKNDLWIGRQRGGLTNLRYDGNTITTKTYTQSDGLAENGVYAVYEGLDQSVWAGTLSGGVSKFTDGHFTTYTRANGLASNTVASITESPDGSIWFATPNGLSALSKGQWRTFTTHDGMPSDNINCLLSDSRGVLWIGTVSGLAFLRAGQVEVPSAAPEPLREEVLGIAEDRNGWLWIATSSHVLSVKRDSLLAKAIGNSDVREYGRDNGLNGTEGVKRDHSVFADSFGRVWFSTNWGLSVANPERAVKGVAPAIVQIEGLSANGNPIDLLQPVRIPPGGQRITLTYSGLSLSVPERVRFKYKLDGFDQNWSEPVSARTAVYTNLRWGTYHFHVTASNSDGIWNDQPATLDFRLEPAWFETTWFRLLFLVSAAFLAWTVYRLQVRQVAHAISARFDERVAERTRIARDLHDTVLQTIQGSKLVADDALEGSADPARVLKAMEQLSVWLGQAAQESRAALNALRASATQKNDLAEALRRATENGFVPSSITLTFSVLGDCRDMHPIVRDEVYRIGYEAIRNACTHSGASHLDVELRYTHDLSVSVLDNGVGIDPSVLDQGREGHFGLRGMRERSDRIGAKLTVHSTTSGTEITLLVPGRIAFRNPASTPLEKLRQFLGD